MSEFIKDELLDEVTGGAAKPTKPAGKGLKWYQVVPGDTLIRIAERHGTTYKHLMELNKDIIKDASLIRTGSWIRVPAR